MELYSKKSNSFGNSMAPQLVDYYTSIHDKRCTAKYPSTKRTLYLFLISVFSSLFFAMALRDILLGMECDLDADDGSQEFAFKRINANINDFPHNSDSNLVFVGIMTAQQYLNTRAPAVYNSWAKSIPGKVAIFAKEDAFAPSDIPVIRLAGTDDAYPPQKKSFMMLKYMYDNYLNHFEYFMRTDDDVYVRPDKLESFLRSVNSTKLQYIGQTGKGNAQEFGQLSLLDHENYCMGGPGMILSRETLARIGPHISECLQNMHTDHEDVEVGRCVQRFAGIPCTWSYEMRFILFNIQDAPTVLSSSLKELDMSKAVSLHPLKDPAHVYKMHLHLQTLQSQKTESDIIFLTRELGDIQRQSFIPLPMLDDPQIGMFFTHLAKMPTMHTGRVHHEKEVVPFSLFSKQILSPYDANPQHRIISSLNESMFDTIASVMNEINVESKERGREIEFKSLLYGYMRFNPGTSVQYVMDLLLLYRKFKGKRISLPVRRHTYLQVPFGSLYVRERQQQNLQSLPSDEVVHFLLPLSGRREKFQRFLVNYQEVVLDRFEAATLTISYFNHTESGEVTEAPPHALVKMIKHVYPGAVIEIVEGEGKFSRAPALELAARGWSSSSLLFCLDVDMAFNENLLPKIRLHTRLNKQVYFPIVYSEFNPSVRGGEETEGTTKVTEESGYFRSFGYGIVSAYKEDLQSVGGFNTSITGWGGEDVDLFEKFIGSSSLSVFRSCEVGLVHIFHTPSCLNTAVTEDEKQTKEMRQTQAKMCAGSVYSTHGAKRTLARKLVEKPHILM